MEEGGWASQVSTENYRRMYSPPGPSMHYCVQPTAPWVYNIAQEKPRVCGASHIQSAHFTAGSCGYPFTS